MATLPGWTALGGSSRRFLNPAGQEVSRRQYENARAAASGWQSWSQYQRVRNTDDFARWAGIAKEKGDRVGPDSDLATKYAAVEKARDEGASDLYDPDGPLADLLTYLDLRAEGDWWDVGDTPGETG